MFDICGESLNTETTPYMRLLDRNTTFYDWKDNGCKLEC